MDGHRFDLWTRRRVGLTAGGLAALLAFPHAGAAKKKKKKKKRCLNLSAICTPGGRKKCCGTLDCDTTGGSNSPITLCCKKAGRCDFNAECCSQQFCNGQNCVACRQADGACSPSGGECCPGLLCFEDKCTEVTSDRALKTNFATIDPVDMLARVRDLPISTWNYTADDPAIRHVGPMAQDFAALFAVGADDRHIHPLDGQGVALAAIQGLLAQIDQLRAENIRLAARVAALERSGEPVTVPYNEAPASTT